ncbi:hypothetical protein Taro_048856 [Colocasia esculenta]|uniref:Uncharacterized protein n=1 Tax=Colocasia esculenta TaxID=4460 RepID=A0A843X984_COLES|nr:hypothetical protein [Colocasia esculenta]
MFQSFSLPPLLLLGLVSLLLVLLLLRLGYCRWSYFLLLLLLLLCILLAAGVATVGMRCYFHLEVIYSSRRSHLSIASTYLSTGILLPEPSQYKTSSSCRQMDFTCRQMFITCRQPTLVYRQIVSDPRNWFWENNSCRQPLPSCRQTPVCDELVIYIFRRRDIGI